MGCFFNSFAAKGEGDSIVKEDLFYYIYGLLHSPEYRARYADNLSKELPRIPAVKKFADFQEFAHPGRELAHWHLDYETVACHQVTFDVAGTAANPNPMRKRGASTVDNAVLADASVGDTQILADASGYDSQRPLDRLSDEQFRVVKMKFPRRKDSQTGKSVPDKTTVIYNQFITVRDIPLEAYDYVVNGKPAIEWVMERQAVTTDKASGIVNDANLWATETMGNPRYPLELLQRVITVSLETMKIVNGLPKLDID